MKGKTGYVKALYVLDGTLWTVVIKIFFDIFEVFLNKNKIFKISYFSKKN